MTDSDSVAVSESRVTGPGNRLSVTHRDKVSTMPSLRPGTDCRGMTQSAPRPGTAADGGPAIRALGPLKLPVSRHGTVRVTARAPCQRVTPGPGPSLISDSHGDPGPAALRPGDTVTAR